MPKLLALAVLITSIINKHGGYLFLDTIASTLSIGRATSKGDATNRNLHKYVGSEHDR